MKSSIEIKTPVRLADRLGANDGEVKRLVVLDNDAGIMQQLAFGKNSSLGVHTADGDVAVLVLEGSLIFTVEGKEHNMAAGDILVMPANVEHSVYSAEGAKVLLTKIK